MQGPGMVRATLRFFGLSTLAGCRNICKAAWSWKAIKCQQSTQDSHCIKYLYVLYSTVPGVIEYTTWQSSCGSLPRLSDTARFFLFLRKLVFVRKVLCRTPVHPSTSWLSIVMVEIWRTWLLVADQWIDNYLAVLLFALDKGLLQQLLVMISASLQFGDAIDLGWPWINSDQKTLRFYATDHQEATKTLEGGLSERRAADFMSQLLPGAELESKRFCFLFLWSSAVCYSS